MYFVHFLLYLAYLIPFPSPWRMGKGPNWIMTRSKFMGSNIWEWLLGQGKKVGKQGQR
mgnify:CR=1 FL=1